MSTGGTGSLARRARLFCIRVHAGEKRQDGVPFYTHPLGVAERLRQHRINDPEVLAAAYLHDVLERTDVTREELVDEFGETVAAIVEEVTDRGGPDRTFDQRQHDLVQQARRLSEKAKLVRMADRLDKLVQKKTLSPEQRQPYARASTVLLDAMRPWPSLQLGESIQRAIQLCMA
jgi:(p)ppGpp synthase/HD superfamily hydrolase